MCSSHVCICLCVTRREEERKMGNRFSQGFAKLCKSPPLKSLIPGGWGVQIGFSHYLPLPLKKYHRVGESLLLMGMH